MNNRKIGPFIKALYPDGRCPWTDFAWPIPQTCPGPWLPPIKNPFLNERGYHVATLAGVGFNCLDGVNWWLAEIGGDWEANGFEVAAETARLTRPLPSPAPILKPMRRQLGRGDAIQATTMYILRGGDLRYLASLWESALELRNVR